MPNSVPLSNELSPWRLQSRLLLAISGAAFIGFADSAYLTAKHYFEIPLPCTITGGCETVLNSPYSMVGPIPLALFGVGFYLTVMFLSLYLFASDAPEHRLVQVLSLLGIAGLVMSIIFESIQIFIIHAICQYCLLQAACAVVIFLCGMWLVRRSANAQH